ncbi:4-hydroxy-tetrahydrodipicolinate reductase [Desulfobotulus alkaliphilus]|uniref:4-hydroxy-tetrahydrodipicolinate reductase n=1 Tax=Desulfobotulus alkaliphilus TaxID=622671 RepID=A0A562RZH6_9BACT|nr:dihydrodipicolinate reductase [Desulfobotulus alkaliphilus]TWI74303.1 4-hydroxy-tetrahydrodipicolinate reductase [Desulfobotulus alkaliphilus]
MSKIPVMVNGLPGNVASTLIPHILADEKFSLIPASLTGPDTLNDQLQCCNMNFSLIRPADRDAWISDVLLNNSGLIAIDYTHPSAVNANATFYARHGIPFVMGTTGGDRDALSESIVQSATCAVIAPNMAKQIVGFQAMMAHAAENFPDLFKGYSLRIEESHQSGKADTSGTAKAMVGYFNRLGIPFGVDAIEMERNPERQESVWGIPSEHIAGHAWHTYTLKSEDGSVCFRFTHNINGRDVYAQGTLDAVSFLSQKITQGCRGQVFSMIDVLKG